MTASPEQTDEKVVPPEEPPLPDDLVLGGAFDPVTREQWQDLVRQVLAKKGEPPADVEAALSTDVHGVSVRPLYVEADALPSLVIRQGPWDVRALHVDPDNTEVLTDLEGGATSLWLVTSDPAPALKDVLLDVAAVALDAGADFHAAGLKALDAGVQLGTLGADPIAVLARTGTLGSMEDALDLVSKCDGLGVRAVTVDALPFHEAGAADPQQLGLALSALVHYLRAGVPADQIELRLGASADQFLTIATMRAARQVWARVLEASGLPSSGLEGGLRLHAVTSWCMTTRRDPWVSMLRGTTAAFAAGVGGADAVTVLPFDSALGRSDAIARRVARNTSALLTDESHVAAVTDPARGSWYVEQLTADVARAAWAVFQQIEGAGGVVSGLQDGSVAASLAQSAAEKQHRLAVRKDAVTGVSEFPFLQEKPVVRKPAGELLHQQGNGGLPRLRWAEPYEDLRDRSDAFLAATGARPAVLAVTTGPPKTFAARLDYVRNLLLPAGVETVACGADEVPSQVPAVVVLVAADDVEPDTDLCAELRERGAVTLLRAGKGKDWPVDGYVHIGCDALAVMTKTMSDLGVS